MAGSAFFPVSKRRMTVLAAGCLGFVAVGVVLFLVGLDDRPRDVVSLVIGSAAVIFFGGGLLLWLWILVRRGPAGLLVDADGFEDSSSLSTAGRVPWSEVTGWTVVEISGQRILCVMVSDPEAVVTRMRSRLARRVAPANQRMVGTPVTIGVSNLQGGEEGVLAAFARFSGIDPDAAEEGTT